LGSVFIISLDCFSNAGEKEAQRWTYKNAVGKCIKSLDQHFAIGRDKPEVNAIKRDLPAGLANIVDQRCNLGGLKYPDLGLYTAMDVVEKVHSLLTTLVKFTMFERMLLENICSGIIRNEIICSLFADSFLTNFQKIRSSILCSIT